MELLGERIKRLRKERKLTLADVAGTRLTKGMLSLIENGKANPSMESLQYIADQLCINPSELIQEDSSNVKELLLKIENLYSAYNEAYTYDGMNKIESEIMERLNEFLKDRTISGNSFEEIRLYEIYLIMNYQTTKQFNEAEIKRVSSMYESIHSFSNTLKGYSFLSVIYFQQFEYEKALSYLLEGEVLLEKYKHIISAIEKIDYYYILCVTYAAVFNRERTEHYLNLSLQIARDKKVFYRLNDFYRFLYYMSLQNNDQKNCDFYLKKINAFSEILEDPLDRVMVELLYLPYINLFLKDYELAIKFEFSNQDSYKDIVSAGMPFVLAEKSYAYFMLEQYEAGIEVVKDFEIPKRNIHPIDLSFLFQGFATRAMCKFKLGQVEDAKRDILYAYNGVKSYEQSLQVKFIRNAYELIMKEKL